MGSLLRTLRDQPTPSLTPASSDPCQGKIRRTRADAERHAAYLMKLPGGKPVEAFDCKLCAHWHVGTLMVKGVKARPKPFKKRR